MEEEGEGEGEEEEGEGEGEGYEGRRWLTGEDGGVDSFFQREPPCEGSFGQNELEEEEGDIVWIEGQELGEWERGEPPRLGEEE